MATPESSRSIIIPTSARWWRRMRLRTVLLRIIAAFVLMTFLTVLLHGNWPLALLLIGSCAGLWLLREEWQHRREREEVLADIDAMSSTEFLRYASELLRAQGYSVQRSGATVSPPADLLLSRGKEFIACWLYQGER